MYPETLKYTKDHEWLQLAGDVGRVGITDFAQKQLGDVVYVELPEVGTVLSAGQAFGTIESVKAVSELFAPVSGEVVEVNTALRDSPEQGKSYAVTITTGVKDLRGNTMAANHSWSFTIASIADAGGQTLFLPVVAQ